MPEGDTVFRAARTLDRALSGRRLTHADLRVPRHATADLVGADVLATVPVGKHLLTRVRLGEDEITLHTHLKMEGGWRVHAAGARWERPAHTARVVLRTSDTEAVGFSLGAVDLLRTADEADVVGHLGPDLLDLGWDGSHLDRAVAALLARPQRPLRNALLDQRLVAGIGNVYAAELCFLARRHPETPVGEMPATEVTEVVSRARRLLRENALRTRRVTTADPRAPLWVYGRHRQPCRRCGTAIRKVESGDVPGQERVSYWCPRCQPADVS